jgi:Cytochrome C oxidase, cbb3-type, subunit III
MANLAAHAQAQELTKPGAELLRIGDAPLWAAPVHRWFATHIDLTQSILGTNLLHRPLNQSKKAPIDVWKATITGATVAIVLTAVFLIACTNPRPSPQASAHTQTAAVTVKKPARHEFYLSSALPARYRGRHNPLKRTIGNLIGGAELYDLHCAACHGTLGIGDGKEGEELTTAPADLVLSLADKSHRDNFFYWTIADGGAQFDSDMPAFSEDLSEREIWKIVIFLRAAFDDSIQDPTASDATTQP